MDIEGYSDNVVFDGSLILIGGKETFDVKMVSPSETKPLPDFPVKSMGHCVTKIDETALMVTGGKINEIHTKDTWVFDFLTETWVQSHPMITERFNHMCAMFKITEKPIVVVAGGWNQVETSIDLVEYLDFHANSGWIQGQPLPTKLRVATMVSYGTGALVIGGKNYWHQLRKEIYRLDCKSSLSDCQWKTMEQELKYPKSRHVSMLIPDSLAKELCG